jgi:hypothetical protein
MKLCKTISGPAESTDLIFQNLYYNPISGETVPLKPSMCIALRLTVPLNQVYVPQNRKMGKTDPLLRSLFTLISLQFQETCTSRRPIISSFIIVRQSL